jgi:hypothetical protein
VGLGSPGDRYCKFHVDGGHRFGPIECYRVSLFSGLLEVSARLKSADDLELLMNVLKVNKLVFAKTDRLATEVLTLTQVSGGSGSAPSPDADGAAA